MAEKEVFATAPCPVCRKPSYQQFDKGGKLFTLCDGRHPENAGCGIRLYYGAGNTARIKAEQARKGRNNGGKKTQPANDNAGAANDNDAGAGDGADTAAGGDDGWRW